MDYLSEMETGFQKKVVWAALTCLSVCVIAAFAVLIIVLLGKFLSVFGNVVMPVAIALILSYMLSPVVELLSTKLRIGKTWACIATLTAILVILLGATAYLLPAVAEQIVKISGALPDAFQKTAAHLSEKFPDAKEFIAQKFAILKTYVINEFSAQTVLDSMKKILSTAGTATGGLISVFAFAAALAVTPIYLFFMLSENSDFFDKLKKNLQFLNPKITEDIVFLTRRFSDVMSTFFRGQILIALIMGILFGAGLQIAGLNFGFLLGFFAGILNIIPYFGTIVGLSIILPVAALQDGGGLWLVCAALVIFCAVQLIESYLLTPKIMGERTGLHPTVIIFSIFFWGVALNGIIGMILAIPLTAFAAALWQRILQRLEESK